MNWEIHVPVLLSYTSFGLLICLLNAISAVDQILCRLRCTHQVIEYQHQPCFLWYAGWMYKLFMLLLAVFCTNSINIHAGLNGLEVGQTVVISAAVWSTWLLNFEYHSSTDDYSIFQVLIHNVMRIGSSKDLETQQAHAFSIYLVLPFLTTSLALLGFNW